MSTAKVVRHNVRNRQIQPSVISESLAATPQLELISFLNLSIGEKTDDYLRQLALRDASTQSIADSSRKLLAHLERLEQSAGMPALTNVKKTGPTAERQAINGVITVPKSALLPAQRWVHAEFAVTVEVVDKLFDGFTPHRTVLFHNTSGGEKGAFTLSFSEFKHVFKVTPTVFQIGQVFNAEVLLANPKTVELRLVEEISANGT